jgi:hypothetical protein
MAVKANTRLLKDMSSWIAKSVEGAGIEYGAVCIEAIEISKGEAIKHVKIKIRL